MPPRNRSRRGGEGRGRGTPSGPRPGPETSAPAPAGPAPAGPAPAAPLSEEDVLISFGQLLRAGDARARALHQKRQDQNMDSVAFITAARHVLGSAQTAPR